MKKTFSRIMVILSLLLLVGCDKLTNDNTIEMTKNETIQPTIEKIIFKEGKYIQIAPSNTGSQGEGYNNYLTLENGTATEFDSYFEITTEGTYTVDGDNLTIHYTRTYGITTYGEPFDDPLDRTIYCHIDDNKVIIDSFSDFEYYDTGSIIYELM